MQVASALLMSPVCVVNTQSSQRSVNKDSGGDAQPNTDKYHDRPRDLWACSHLEQRARFIANRLTIVHHEARQVFDEIEQ